MRRIPMKTVGIRLAGQDPAAPDIEFSYARNILGVVNAAAGERGLPLSEISKLLRIVEPVQAALDAGADHVLLEDADWQHLAKVVESFRGWRIVHPIVPAFVKDIAEAECIAFVKDIAEAECIAPSGVLSANT